MKRAILKTMHLDGKWQVAGYTVLPVEVPKDVMEKVTSAPQLGKMVIVGPDDDKHLSTPDALTKKWYHHPVFGSRYRAFLDGFYEDGLYLCGVIVVVG